MERSKCISEANQLTKQGICIYLKETDHAYQGALCGNPKKSYNGRFESWDEFKDTHVGFLGENNFDDDYNFVFRYDIYNQENGLYKLEVCILLQRKGIYTNLDIYNIESETLNTEVKEWLKGRAEYLKKLWTEVL